MCSPPRTSRGAAEFDRLLHRFSQSPLALHGRQIDGDGHRKYREDQPADDHEGPSSGVDELRIEVADGDEDVQQHHRDDRQYAGEQVVAVFLEPARLRPEDEASQGRQQVAEGEQDAEESDHGSLLS